MFNNKKTFPSRCRKFIFSILILLVPLAVFAKVKIIKWEDEKWTFYVNPHHYFMILGPWSEQPLLIDRGVNDSWGIGSDPGLYVVYQKGIEFRWVLLQRETGEKVTGGDLFFMGPDTGYVQWIGMARVQDGITIKVAFDTGQFTLYQIDAHGNKTVLREGKND